MKGHAMTQDKFETLRRAVVDASEANIWTGAVHEWDVIELEEDATGQGECVCGKTHLVYLYTIKNHRNGNMLFPIGSSCVNHFGVEELTFQVNILGELLQLRAAFAANKPVTMTKDYFSRALLEELYSQGAFTPNDYNSQDGWNDYDFLLQMFNKRKKEDITRKQEQKIYMLIQHAVRPFVLNDGRLR